MKRLSLLLSALILFSSTSFSQTKEELIEIAKEAFIYGYPVVENYRVMFQSTQNKTFPQYAPLNTFYHAKNVATPADTLFVSPNVDTPYSSAVLYVGDEPVVLSIPEVEEDRFVGVPFYDLFTHVTFTISPLNFGHSGGDFLISNEKWKGTLPKGIKKHIVSESDLLYVLIRTQLFDQEDLSRVNEIQQEYQVKTLSAYLGKPALPSSDLQWIPPMAPQSPFTEPDLEFLQILNFALQFANPHPSEKDLLNRFSKIGVIAGQPFETTQNPLAEELKEGIRSAQKSFLTYLPQIKSSSEIFGSREYLQNNYLGRAVGAWTGIYANEASVFLGINGYERQADGKPFSGENRYSFTFPPNDFPPVDAFWSITLYKLPSRSLYANPIQRYAIQSRMKNQFRRNPDGSVKIYVQHESPGKDLESNWLPCPPGPFTMAFRCYLPQKALQDQTWMPPLVIKASN